MKSEIQMFEPNCKIAVLGGDTRQTVIADILAGAGHEIAVFGIGGEHTSALATRCVTFEDAVRSASAVILPLPFSCDNVRVSCSMEGCEIPLTDLFAMLEPGTAVVGGRFNESAAALAAQADVLLYDYCDCDDINILNAVPTAEGAIALAMQTLPFTLHGSRCTVVGFGRCGKTLAHDLSGLGAAVTVTARSQSDLAWIRVYGWNVAVTGDPQGWNGADVIFNTVPHKIFDRAAVESLPQDVLIIDLASGAGGVDTESAASRGIQVLHALSLPGKVAPLTAGRILAAPLLRLLHGEAFCRS